MPRRQPQPEIPRWRRGKQSQAPVIQVSKRQARRMARDMTAALAVRQQEAVSGTAVAVPGARAAAVTGAYRFRMHLVPFAWLAAVTGASLGAHLAHAPERASFLLSLLASVMLVLLCRHLSEFARGCSAVLAALTALWLPLLAAFGWSKPWPALLVLSWVPLAGAWVRHYRWRPSVVQEHVPDMGDLAIWNRLAAKNKWTGHLGSCTELPGGGRQWSIVLDGAETHIGQVLTEPRKVAAAWGKSAAEAYAEPAPDGVESRGRLTILKQNTLVKSREWNGAGIDLETGVGVVGRFPDGQPLHERYFIRRNGVRHTIVAGADGSGKTGLLDLGLCLSATSGIIAPVLLDPQEGQALPAWKGHVPYACGVDECMAYLRGLHAAMLDRSRHLAGVRWSTEDGDERVGMGFFDAFMTGLPIIEITIDESPALLADAKNADEARYLLATVGKMGRKAGFRIRLAVQVPSLSELGGQELRSMLVGGNVFCGRTGDRVSSGMVGIKADPHDLPKYFPGGSPTVGLGYASGPDNRPGTQTRWDWVSDPYKVARSVKIRPVDEMTAAAMARFSPQVQEALPTALPTAPLTVVAGDDDAAEGRSASDAILLVLRDAGRGLERGEIARRCAVLATGDWGREKPFAIRSIQNALNALTADGQIEKVPGGKQGVYALTRASLAAVQ